MVIHLGPDLEAALIEMAHQRGVAPEAVALDALRERFLTRDLLDPPRDEWERRLRSIATNCGVALSDWDVSREAMYD